MSKDAKSKEITLHKEEIRGFFTLGLMAVLAAYRSVIGPGKVKILLVDTEIAPLIDALIILWGIYAAMMIIGVSTDFFSEQRCQDFRNAARFSLMLSFMILIIVGFFIVYGSIAILIGGEVGLYLVMIEPIVLLVLIVISLYGKRLASLLKQSLKEARSGNNQ